MDNSFDFTLPTVQKNDNDEDDYNDDADHEKLAAQMAVASQQQFQTEAHIPTHQQLQLGITKEVLIDRMSVEERTRLNLTSQKDKLEESEKISDEKKSEDKSLDTPSKKTETKLHRQDSESIRKKAKFTKEEKERLENLGQYAAFLDPKLSSKGKMMDRENKELLDQICDKYDKQKLAKLFYEFDDDQEEQYVQFRRSSFQKASVKRLVQTAIGSSIAPSENVLIAMKGIAKVYAGEIIERAVKIKNQLEGDDTKNSIEPFHIREAIRCLENNANCYVPSRPGYKRKYSGLL
jgi:transcription initiation factor TFIID subunit 11